MTGTDPSGEADIITSGPRDPLDRRRRLRAPLRRRDILRGGMWLVAGAATAPLLSACSNRGSQVSGIDYEIATPTSPIKLPILEDNQPIESGLEPEDASVLRVLNYAEYLAPAVLRDFEDEHGAEVHTRGVHRRTRSSHQSH